MTIISKRRERLYREAGQIALVALGQKTANDDPLAYWLLINWIVEVAVRFRDAPIGRE